MHFQLHIFSMIKEIHEALRRYLCYKMHAENKRFMLIQKDNVRLFARSNVCAQNLCRVCLLKERLQNPLSEKASQSISLSKIQDSP